MNVSSFSTIIPESIIDLLEALNDAGKFEKGWRGGISLAQPMLQKPAYAEALSHIKGCIKGLGVDESQIGYIVDIVNNVDVKKGFRTYSASVKGTAQGDVILSWGKSETSLMAMKSAGVRISFTGDKYISATLEFMADDVEYTVEVPLRTIHGSKLTKAQARTAFAKQELGYLLQYKPANMTEVEPGLYTIIEAKVGSSFNGIDKYHVRLEGQKAWFSAPKKLETKLFEESVKPTTSEPWTIKLGEIKSITSDDGRSITYRDVVRVSTGATRNVNLDDFILEAETSKVRSTDESDSALAALAADFELE